MISPWQISLIGEEFRFNEDWLSVTYIRRGDRLSVRVSCFGFFHWGFNNMASDGNFNYWMLRIANELLLARHPKAREFLKVVGYGMVG